MILALLLALQTTPVTALPKGNALPPPGTEEAAIMAPVTALLTALTNNDGAAVLAVTLPEGAITAARTAPDGTRQRKTQRWAELAATLKPGGPRIEEPLGTPAIEVDGDIAMVWAPFTVLADGKVAACGYDHFDLVRDKAGWKLLNVTYSHRTTGCAQ